MKLHILLAEDHSSIRELCVAVLQSAGHEVVAAENGNKALEALLYHPETDLVITDNEMPGGPLGLEVVRFVRVNHPHIKIVLMSGRDVDAKVAATAGADIVLMKPFTPETFAQVIQQLFSRNPPSGSGVTGVTHSA